jgi:hypothetical protein
MVGCNQNPVGLVFFKEEEDTLRICICRGNLGEDTARRRPFASHIERAQEKPNSHHFDLGLPVSRTMRK